MPSRSRIQKGRGEAKRRWDTDPCEQSRQWLPFGDGDGNHVMFLTSLREAHDSICLFITDQGHCAQDTGGNGCTVIDGCLPQYPFSY